MDACHTARLSLCCSPSLCSSRSSFASSHPPACGVGMSRQGNRVTEAVPLLSWIFASTLTGGFLRGISLNSVIVKSRSMKQKRKHSLLVKGAVGPNDGVRWWEKKGPPNMHDISSTQDFVNALGDAGEKLVVVDFFGSWCGSCRTLYPKLCKLAEEYRDVIFLKVNFDENKKMCKSLNVKVLPYFHFYRGAEGRLDAFSCSLAKLQKLKGALASHNTARCSLGPSVGVGDLLTALDQPAAAGSTR